MMVRLDFGIGPRQRLLLAAALSPDKDRGAAALDEWWSGIASFDEVHGTDSGLFAQIHANLGRRIRDPRLAARMKGAARHVWARNSYMIADCTRIVGALADAGIPAMLLKGAAMVVAIDQGTGLRWMSDCDVLVPLDKARPAVRLLAELGFTERQPLRRRDLRTAHGVPLIGQESGQGRVDLHWRPIRDIGARRLAREMFAAGRPATIGDRPCLTPAFEHMVFHTIVHGAEWSPHPRYDWLVDTAKILVRAGPEFDWTLLRRTAETYRFAYLVGAAVREAHRHFPDLVPENAATDFVGWPAPVERREARVRMARPSTRTTADELLVALQRGRRSTTRALRRPLVDRLARLYRALYGPPAVSSATRPVESGRWVPLYGWSTPELHGRWTEGRFASLLLRHAGDRPPKRLRIDAVGLAMPSPEPQVVRAYVGFRPIGEMVWWYGQPNPFVQSIVLPPWAWRERAAIVRLDIGQRIVPAEAGLSDPRALGILVRDIRHVEPARDLVSDWLRLTDEDARPVMWDGWSDPEPNGCWTFGGCAVLRWRTSVPIPADHKLLVALVDRVPGPDYLRGRFIIDDAAPTSFEYGPFGLGENPVELPMPRAYSAGEPLELQIEIDNPAAPDHVLNNRDTRPLGLMVAAIRIVPGSAGGLSPPA